MSTQELTSEQIYNEEPLTSTVRPDTMATLTVRVVKSFPYRSVKNHIFHNIDLTTTTVASLLSQIQTICKTQSAFRAYKTHADNLDTVKVYTRAHGSKTMNLVINFDHDYDEVDSETGVLESSWVISNHPAKTLKDCGVENETELSVFNRKDYEEFKKNPEEKWM